ncbi:conserved hypothetical protein [Roseibium sp. TrichSKD4]|nr:conserved hypothetical protein [Roseibium sp. TrichSKD4]
MAQSRPNQLSGLGDRKIGSIFWINGGANITGCTAKNP